MQSNSGLAATNDADIVSLYSNNSNPQIGSSVRWNVTTNGPVSQYLWIVYRDGTTHYMDSNGYVNRDYVEFDIDVSGRYKVYVLTRDPSGNTDNKEEVFEITDNSLRELTRPTITYPSNNGTVSDGSTTIRWNPVEGASYYKLAVKDLDDNNKFMNDVNIGNVTEYTIASRYIKPGHRYQVALGAYNANTNAWRESFFEIEELNADITGGLSSITLSVGESKALEGTITSDHALEKVSIDVENWYGGVYESKFPNSKSYNLANFTIDASKEPFNEPGTYYVNIWFKAKGYEAYVDDKIRVEIEEFDLEKDNSINLEVSGAGENYVELAWDSIKDANDYKVYKANSLNELFISIGSTRKNTFFVSDLLSNQEYYFKVKVVTEDSIYTSPYISATTLDYPSDWAKEEVNKAREHNLLTDKVQSNYTENITREEFCELMIKLYEAITNKQAIYGNNPFTDTDNIEILKAYHLGIVNGYKDDIFAPNMYINRQQMATMLYRTLNVANDQLDNTRKKLSFDDASDVSDWAEEAVEYLTYHKLINGVGNNLFSPLTEATKEQAIALVKRIYDSYNDLPDKDDRSNMVIKPVFKGDYVREIQQQLLDWINTNNIQIDGIELVSNIFADGIFGAKTKVVVKLFQQYNNLSVDGLVGSNTSKTLSSPSSWQYRNIPNFSYNSGILSEQPEENAEDIIKNSNVQVKDLTATSNDLELARGLLEERSINTLSRINQLDTKYQNHLKRTVDEINKVINNVNNMTIEEVYFYFVGIEKVRHSLILIGSVNTDENMVNTVSDSFDKTFGRIITTSVNTQKLINYLKNNPFEGNWKFLAPITKNLIPLLEGYQKLITNFVGSISGEMKGLFAEYDDELFSAIADNVFKDIEEKLGKTFTDVEFGNLNIVSTKRVFEYLDHIEISAIYKNLDNSFMNYCWYNEHFVEYTKALKAYNSIDTVFTKEIFISNKDYFEYWKTILVLQTFADGFQESANILDLADDKVRVVKLISIAKKIEEAISVGLDTSKITYTILDFQNVYNTIDSGVSNIWQVQ